MSHSVQMFRKDKRVDGEESYWNDDDDKSIQSCLADAFRIPNDAASRVTWAYPARINRKYKTGGTDPIVDQMSSDNTLFERSGCSC